MTDNMVRLEEISLSLPEAQRVDIEAWDGHPTFRVRGKNFVFCNVEATSLTVKLSKEEAEAVVATESFVSPASYGLGRHGWVVLDIGADVPEELWDQLEEWIYTSYTLVAPKRLARIVLDADTRGGQQLDS
jgi:predicted DNA-binding protein (MmcQ/YjbR family)